MADVSDGYDGYYADRLWQVLPAVYRALDSDTPGVPGPLQELVARIGAQAAVVRRSIDRLWADQSIETCDDWVVPYIGDLLGTRLVSQDARGQRLEVAKAIHYRRRKGTVAVLEELARDLTGWQAHALEGFRRVSRTRHRLDPPVGSAPLQASLPQPCGADAGSGGSDSDARRLLTHAGLLGPLTGTPIGGSADLRSVHGATLAGTAFDEYFHTVDVRAGSGATGWYGIPKLLVFLWRLRSFAVAGGTPVPIGDSTTDYVFDPTGRRIPLFLPPLGPEPDDWVDAWTPATEWQVPGPLGNSLQQAIDGPETGSPPHPPYPDLADIPPFTAAAIAASAEPIPIQVTPETGEFHAPVADGGPLAVDFQFGLPAAVGAGPYDRAAETDPPATVGSDTPVTGGSGLDIALAGIGASGTVTIGDSRTYVAVDAVGSTAAPIDAVLVRAADGVRPVVRLPATAPDADPAAWVFTGGGPDSELILDGLLISGGDIVLRGGFRTVRLTACTIDPGTLDSSQAAFDVAADGRPLAPAHIWIEADPGAAGDAPGAIAGLTIDHCVLGPVRTRNGGAVEAIEISDSIVQGISPAPDAAGFTAADVRDPQLLLASLAATDTVSETVDAALTAAGQSAAETAIAGYAGGLPSADAVSAVVAGLNAILPTGSLFSAAEFVDVPLPPAVSAAAEQTAPADVAGLNRALLEAAYPVALSAAAIAVVAGTVSLDRVTVLGGLFAHRLQASDSILADFAAVEDRQTGCVRFSAVAAGSVLPGAYQCAGVADADVLFTSRSFGHPAYGQLRESADAAVTPIAAGDSAVAASVTAGAEDGSEMGVYSSELGPLKEQRLLAKYDEYMPLGLTPVVIHVT